MEGLFEFDSTFRCPALLAVGHLPLLLTLRVGLFEVLSKRDDEFSTELIPLRDTCTLDLAVDLRSNHSPAFSFLDLLPIIISVCDLGVWH